MGVERDRLVSCSGPSATEDCLQAADLAAVAGLVPSDEREVSHAASAFLHALLTAQRGRPAPDTASA